MTASGAGLSRPVGCSINASEVVDAGAWSGSGSGLRELQTGSVSSDSNGPVISGSSFG